MDVFMSLWRVLFTREVRDPSNLRAGINAGGDRSVLSRSREVCLHLLNLLKKLRAQGHRFCFLASVETASVVSTPVELLFSNLVMLGDLYLNPNGGDVLLSGDNLGIDIATPEARIHVFNGAAGTITASAATALVVEDNGNVNIETLSPDANFGQILFRSPTAASVGAVTYNHNGSGTPDVMELYTANTQRVTIDNAGTVTVNAGFVTKVLEANLTAGACTAGTWKVDNTTTRELCRCNDAGSAYDCISVTTTNGPTD